MMLHPVHGNPQNITLFKSLNPVGLWDEIVFLHRLCNVKGSQIRMAFAIKGTAYATAWRKMCPRETFGNYLEICRFMYFRYIYI